VRLGERLLYVGAGTPALFASLAGKAGLTGRARAVVESETASERIKMAAARAGVLIEVAVASMPALAADDAAFDVAVIDASGGAVPTMSEPDLAGLAREVLRTLRPRGRAIVIEREPRGVLATFKERPKELERFRAENAAGGMLQAAGFQPVRLLAERDGQRFTEGWKRE
jgi:ubiquinone/menaquinone biosynthesis C-methylase UbiE